MAINCGPTLASNMEDFCTVSKSFLKQMEGYFNNPYVDTKGNITVGIGFNLNKVSDLVCDITNRPYTTPKMQLSMTDAQIDEAFLELYGIRNVKKIQEATGLPFCRELIALASLSYNSPALFGSGLQAALNLPDPHDARAEAWYQIRYVHADELWKRRYAEAALFGLYDDSIALPGKDESLAVYRMYTQHQAFDPNSSAASMIDYDKNMPTI